MSIACIAIVGKQNNPLYPRNFTSNHPDLKYHYIAHTACDSVDERANATQKSGDPYLGLLYTVEDLAIYGYMTNTRIKFIVVVSVAENIVKDTDMRSVFKKIHASYIALVSNPFYDADTTRTITSPKFHKWIDSIVAT